MSYRYIIVFTIIIAICTALDLYTWFALKRTLTRPYQTFFKWFIPLSTILFFVGFGLNILRGSQGVHNANYFLNILTGFTFGIFIAKLIIAVPFILEDIVRYVTFLIKKIGVSKEEVNLAERRNFVRNIALAAGAIPLSGALYAITFGKYNFQVKRRKYHFKNLPKSFDGLKIVHFTDFHAGSFDDERAVKKGLQLINEQNPDIVLFTGDLVNNRATEAEPYIKYLKTIKARVGKYAILGNHDYGEYMPFSSEEEKLENFNKLTSIFKEIGFKLLRNDHIVLGTEKDNIILGGVENWGNSPFPQYGDLDKTFENTDSQTFKILMSHDPDHWDAKILSYKKRIDLTLSGHTHGAQFGISIPNWKWSPVKYRYKRWLGRYENEGKYLYVSKGFGFLGFPGRIGMSPEIVVHELYSGSEKLVTKS